jgi:hypothetical protein
MSIGQLSMADAADWVIDSIDVTRITFCSNARSVLGFNVLSARACEHFVLRACS